MHKEREGNNKMHLGIDLVRKDLKTNHQSIYMLVYTLLFGSFEFILESCCLSLYQAYMLHTNCLNNFLFNLVNCY